METTNTELQERQDAPLVLTSSGEPLNPTSQSTYCNDGSTPCVHSGSGCNSGNGGRMSAHDVFVLGVDGKPLTPTTSAKARKMMKGGMAKPVWNKFGQFGVQMTVETRKEHPKTSLGVDFGTKFEGYSVIVGKENQLNAMWKLPDKKKTVRKVKNHPMNWVACLSKRLRGCLTAAHCPVGQYSGF